MHDSHALVPPKLNCARVTPGASAPFFVSPSCWPPAGPVTLARRSGMAPRVLVRYRESTVVLPHSAAEA